MKIEIQYDSLNYLKKEFKKWGVNKDKYSFDDNVLITSDNNIIDIVTETLDPRHYIIIS